MPIVCVVEGACWWRSFKQRRGKARSPCCDLSAKERDLTIDGSEIAGLDEKSVSLQWTSPFELTYRRRPPSRAIPSQFLLYPATDKAGDRPSPFATDVDSVPLRKAPSQSPSGRMTAASTSAAAPPNISSIPASLKERNSRQTREHLPLPLPLPLRELLESVAQSSAPQSQRPSTPHRSLHRPSLPSRSTSLAQRRRIAMLPPLDRATEELGNARVASRGRNIGERGERRSKVRGVARKVL